MAKARRGAAPTTRAPPTAGATATSTPTISVSVVAAARAHSTAARHDDVAAPIDSSAARRTSALALASNSGPPLSGRGGPRPPQRRRAEPPQRLAFGLKLGAAPQRQRSPPHGRPHDVLVVEREPP